MFCAILLVLLAVGFVIKYIWWFVGGAVLVGVFAGIYWFAQKAEKERRLEAAEREFEMTRRAERQKLWTLIARSPMIANRTLRRGALSVSRMPDQASHSTGTSRLLPRRSGITYARRVGAELTSGCKLGPAESVAAQVHPSLSCPLPASHPGPPSFAPKRSAAES
ncbi:hypothetical protein [Mycobacterium sp. ZZG]